LEKLNAPALFGVYKIKESMKYFFPLIN